MDAGLELRQKLQSSGCSFEAKITADYGSTVHTFSLQCTADPEGNISFTVQQPESIQGIAGTLSARGGALTFDHIALAFPMLAEGELSPVSAPWLLIKTLRSGYIRASTLDSENIRLTIHDSYEENALQLDIWLDEDHAPKYAQVFWQERSILSMEVSNFLFL